MFFTLIFKISVKKILTEMKIYVNKIKIAHIPFHEVEWNIRKRKPFRA